MNYADNLYWWLHIAFLLPSMCLWNVDCLYQKFRCRNLNYILPLMFLFRLLFYIGVQQRRALSGKKASVIENKILTKIFGIKKRWETQKSRKLGPTKEVGLNSAIRAPLNVLENDIMGCAVRTHPRIKRTVRLIMYNCVRNLAFVPLVCLSVIVYSCFSLLLCLNHGKLSIFCITFHKIFRNSEILW
jgi:hypothetical protein